MKYRDVVREMEDLDRWISDLNKRVCEEWNTKYSWWTPGFKTLIGSAIPNPSIAIISLNPGRRNRGTPWEYEWEDLEKCRSGNFPRSDRAPYFKDRPDDMALAIQDLFGGDRDLLYYETVAFFAFFFRSKGWKEVTQNFQSPHPTKQDAKDFCFPIVREMVERFQPARLVVIGLQPYGYLNKSILARDGQPSVFEEKREVPRAMGGRLIQEAIWHSDWGVVPVFATAHLTGDIRPRLIDDERTLLREELHDWLSNE